ncbi:uncharacterized protein N7483_003628 [Penicillium malachiteum]|uniref:uncharacterized protein n=1 Tax=Penicillium malachiteum TaxID=1324776 RepID=UPI0025488A38|nr:uncharacterized protein N7483_003628 [Penicillium malachiteum]KAJ5729120.1 hypothetical protein N7483_003628 [Penicillium malachiteum]
MTQTTRPFKVIISGGGVAGLSLALMLEKVGLDYVLLEAYSEIVSNKSGTGIVMLPNGNRILDQLGCYESLVHLAGNPIESVSFKDPSGELLSYTEGWQKRASERYGYMALWCDRGTVLQAMYDQIEDKSKILVDKKVDVIQQTDSEVEVTTADGSVYRGDIIVGADGVHSRVRQEIAHHASKMGLGEEYTAESVPSTYSCLFGISGKMEGLPEATLDYVLNKKFSYIIGTGPANRTYWGLMKNLGQTFHGSEIPRFGEKDKEEMIKEHWNDKIAPGVSVSDLYNNRLRPLFMAPMREYTYKRWHSGRMMMIGDAAHQMTVIIGQGGNQAVEDAAALTNHLVSALSSSTTERLSYEEIQRVFEGYQQARFDRVSRMVELSHQRQLMDSLDTPELEEIMLHKFPATLPGSVVQRWDQTFEPAACLYNLPVPARAKEFRWVNEPKDSESKDS